MTRTGCGYRIYLNSMKNTSILYTNAKLIGADRRIENGWLLSVGGLINGYGEGLPPDPISTGAERKIDCQRQSLMPGFIDLHTHGAVGVDLVGATREQIQEVSRFFASRGVSAFLATTWAASPGEILATLESVRAVMGSEDGAEILGVHLEGPFINPIKAGAQSPREIRAARPEEVLPYLDSGIVRMVTLAPEIEENRWLFAECEKRGVTVAVGHSDATYEQMQAAAGLGLSHVTHCYNAMRGFNHREPGVLGAALDLRGLSCEIILDKVHAHPAAVRLLLAAKSRDKVVLVTDSISGTGMPPGVFHLEGKKVTYTDEDARLADGTLAGSVLTMDRALRNLVEVSGEPLEQVWMCASRNAAGVIGLDASMGQLKVGTRADLVLLNPDLEVTLTTIRGRIVFEHAQ